MADDVNDLAVRLTQKMVDHVAADVADGPMDLAGRMVALCNAGLRVAISVQAWAGTDTADAIRQCQGVLAGWLAQIEDSN